MGDEDLLAEQRRYYQARAPMYDEWWRGTGRYDRGEEERGEWDRQVATVEAALDGFAPTGDVLELAGGTGWWTHRLARSANSLTVVDSSPETLAINRERVRRADVDYVVADLFDWAPPRRFDVVFFSFWLSHVPRSRFAAFWELVRSALTENGRAFLIDNRNDPLGSSDVKDPYVVEYGPDVHLRHVGDRSRWRVVKVMYEPDELQALIGAAGWEARIDATRWFLFGSAQPVTR